MSNCTTSTCRHGQRGNIRSDGRKTCSSLHNKEPLAQFCWIAKMVGLGPVLHSGPCACATDRARTRTNVQRAALGIAGRYSCQ